MEIVIAQESHIPEIKKLWLEFSKYHESLNHPWYPIKAEAATGFEAYLRKEMIAEESRVMVALDKNCVVGYIIAMINKMTEVWVRERYGCIDQIAIAAAHRHKGIGSAMLKEILNWLQSENIDLIELSIAANNRVGHSFWEKHGFKDSSHTLFLNLP
jgi:ribosomal protein S18 acetylase RimI-like enzyme